MSSGYEPAIGAVDLACENVELKVCLDYLMRQMQMVLAGQSVRDMDETICWGRRLLGGFDVAAAQKYMLVPPPLPDYDRAEFLNSIVPGLMVRIYTIQGERAGLILTGRVKSIHEDRFVVDSGIFPFTFNRKTGQSVSPAANNPQILEARPTGEWFTRLEGEVIL